MAYIRDKFNPSITTDWRIDGVLIRLHSFCYLSPPNHSLHGEYISYHPPTSAFHLSPSPCKVYFFSSQRKNKWICLTRRTRLWRVSDTEHRTGFEVGPLLLGGVGGLVGAADAEQRVGFEVGPFAGVRGLVWVVDPEHRAGFEIWFLHVSVLMFGK